MYRNETFPFWEKICESDLYALKPDERIPFIYFKGGKGSALSNIY